MSIRILDSERNGKRFLRVEGKKADTPVKFEWVIWRINDKTEEAQEIEAPAGKTTVHVTVYCDGKEVTHSAEVEVRTTVTIINAPPSQR